MSSTSLVAFANFLVHSLVFNQVNFGLSAHIYLLTLETSVIGTNNLSSQE